MKLSKKILAQVLALIVSGALFSSAIFAADETPRQIMFKNVNIFDGKSDNLVQGKDVLIQNNLIKSVGSGLAVAANVEVIDGVLNRESQELNRRFNTFHTKKRPYILLKWAQTKDGFIDLFREPGQAANPSWITDEYCRMLVHKWRTEESSILVGTRTAQTRHPLLHVLGFASKLFVVVDPAPDGQSFCARPEAGDLFLFFSPRGSSGDVHFGEIPPR